MKEELEIKGVTLSKVTVVRDSIQFTAEDGREWQMFHSQQCCEKVWIEDIVGRLEDLCGTPILMAEIAENRGNPKSPRTESCTWTFYKFATVKGYVTIRWYGESNGYYSERVTFRRKRRRG